MDECIREIFGDSKSVPENWVKRRNKPGDPDKFYDTGVSEEDNQPSQVTYEDYAVGKVNHQPEADDIPDMDLYLNAEVILPQNG